MTQHADNANTAPKTQILIVDDHPLFRRGVVQLLAMDSEFAVAGEARNGEEALRIVERADPDLILLDLNMRGMGGLETLHRLRAQGVDTRIVVLTVSDSDEDVVAALRAGADGYLLKDMEPEQLLEQVKEAAVGKMVLSPQLTAVVANALRSPSLADDNELASLTNRELDILRCLARGLSNKMIARDLDIAEGTVKVHVKNLLKKLGLRSRVEAAVWAVNHHIE